MGLLRFSQFSSIPNLRTKIRQRTKRIEDADISKAPLTKTEFIYSNGILRGDDSTAVNTATTIFTVAADTILYVIGLTLSWHTEAADVSDGVVARVAGNDIIAIETSDADNDHGEVSVGFAVPIRLTEGQTIQVVSTDANIRARVSHTSYELTLEQEKLFKF